MSARLPHVVIAGGGPVGMALGVALARTPGIEVTLVEREPRRVHRPASGFDHRVYALSPSSMAFLAHIGVGLDAARIAPVQAMRIRGDQPGHELEFAEGRPLAVIVEHAELMRGLDAAAPPALNVRHGVSIAAMADVHDGNRTVLLSDGTSLVADLVAGADGGRSALRELTRIGVVRKDYGDDGVVANFSCEHAHGDIARQWFFADSVLAWLPLPGRQVSMVWSVARERANQLTAMDAGSLCAAVARAGNEELGTMCQVSPVQAFPLGRSRVERWVLPSLALLGDAAHTVHPLAGQGVNLGLGDARSLADLISGRSRFESIGGLPLLRRYERARKESALALGEVTDRLRGLYRAQGRVAEWLRNDGLGLLDGMPAVKGALVNYAARSS
ncbi:MAG TPA: FAD-dependent monooxygenase [Usitatibacteraceae bacterium]|nr:FAD-dependent monooxygenase [Usitatibacteraceae bacterium]